MIHNGSWPHRVKNSAHGSNIVYTYLVETGVKHATGIPQRFGGAPNSDFEHYAASIREMRKWCREFVGPEITTHNCRSMRVTAHGNRVVCFLFLDKDHAFAFNLRFGGRG